MASAGMDGLSSDGLYTGRDYATANPNWHDEDSAFKAANVAAIVAANRISCPSVVDVGCGVGGVLDALFKHDVFRASTGVGYDIAPYAIETAKKRETDRLSFRCGDFLQGTDTYDLLLLMDVFEHVDDYLGFLRKLRGRSRHYAFHIPLDMNLIGLLRGDHMKRRKDVGHLHYFDRQTALATLRDTGYRIVDARYTTMEDVFEVHPEYRTATALIGRAGRRVIKAVAGEDLTVRLFGGSSLMVLAG